MKQSWNDYERAAEQGPLSVGIKGIIGLAVLVFVGWLVMFPLGCFTSVVNEAAQVAKEQVGPRALLVKYEWFKDAHAALEQKRATIGVYEARLDAIKADYGAKATNWPRDVRESQDVARSEMAGIVASYNELAAQYNANMAKVHWAFTNRGGLPAGATEPLPREVAPYLTH